MGEGGKVVSDGSNASCSVGSVDSPAGNAHVILRMVMMIGIMYIIVNKMSVQLCRYFPVSHRNSSVQFRLHEGFEH